MAHTTQYEDPENPGCRIVFIHNGGYDGSVTIRRVKDEEILSEIEVDFDVLKWFVAGFVRQERIQGIEDASSDEILLGRPD